MPPQFLRPLASAAGPSSLIDYEGCYHYLPIADSIFHGGIYLTGAGHGVISPGTPYPPIRHPKLYHFDWHKGRVLPEFSLILITAGSGVFESKVSGRVKISRGQSIFLFPGVWHRYRPERQTGWTEKWLQFNGEFAHLLLDQQLIGPSRAVLQTANFRAVEAALDRLLARIDAEPYNNSLLLSLHALSVLTLAIGEPGVMPPTPPFSATPPTPKDALVAAALEYIWTRSHRVIAVADVAAAIGVTRRLLERRVKAKLGRSVLDEI